MLAMNWVSENASLIGTLVLLGATILMLFPTVSNSSGKRSKLLGYLLIPASLAALGWVFLQPTGDMVRDILFYVAGGTAVIGGLLMTTERNPVYAALWFAVATLGVCGLFVINSAPFLAAVTIIVYAGAIVVTFVFVIMLAQQEKSAGYDRIPQQPLLATVLGCLLVGTMLVGIHKTFGPAEPALLAVDRSNLHVSSRPVEGDLGSPRGIGRTLFTDYLFAVELAGTILLVATIGAIAIAPRRPQGSL